MTLQLASIQHEIFCTIMALPEQEFWNLVSIRLNTPFSKNQIKEFEITDATSAEELPRYYWTEEFLINKLFLQLAGTGLSLPTELLRKIDAERGDISRSRFLLRLIERAYKDKKSKTEVQA